MLISIKRGQTGFIVRVKILDSSVATGAGKTGLTSASSGLIISTIADNEATAVGLYTVAGSTIETITTLGTYAAPTATKVRFKEVDATNHKGVYELHVADARYAVTNAKYLLLSISGAAGAAECDALIPLTAFDPYDAVRAGLTALPNVAVNGEGGLFTGSGKVRENWQTFFFNDDVASTGVVEDLATLIGRLTSIRAGYLDAAISSRSTVTTAQVNTEADTALTDYGALKPTTAGRTLDVSTTGEAGLDWANIGTPSTSVSLGGTTVGAALALAANSITASVLAADAITEIQAGLSTLTIAQVNTEADTALADVGLTTTITGRIDAAISTRSTITTAQVNTEVDTAIVDARLDELLAADSDIDGAAPPTVGSVFHELMSKTAGSWTYDQTTDSNEAIRDSVAAAGPSAAVIADAVWDEVQSGHLTAGTFGLFLDAATTTLTGRLTSGRATLLDNLANLDYAASTINDNALDAVAQATAAADDSAALRAVYTNGRAANLDFLDIAVSSRLAPTVAARTLDVSATGEAGLDFDNLKAATSTTTLTNIIVPAVTIVLGMNTGVITSGVFAAGAINAAAIAADAITDAKIASDVVTAIQSGLSTLTAAQVNTEADAALADVGLTTTITGRIDAAISTRLSTAGYTAPDNAGITTLTSRVTATRAGYWDNLNVGGLVASATGLQAITQSSSIRVMPPQQMERPDDATPITYRVWVYSYNETNQAEDLDANPTVTAENNTGEDRSANLGTVTKLAATTGQYYVDYSVAQAHAIEGLVFKVTATEGAVATVHVAASNVVDSTSVSFTNDDRMHLDALWSKLPSSTYLAGTNNVDGALEADAFTGNFVGNVGGLENTDNIYTTVGFALTDQGYTIARADNLDNLNATITSRMATFPLPTNWSVLVISGIGQVQTSNPGSAPTVAQIRTEMDTNSTKLDVAVGTRLATAGYTVPLTAAQVNAEADAALADVGLTTTITGRIDASILSRMASFTLPTNFSAMAITPAGEVDAGVTGGGDDLAHTGTAQAGAASTVTLAVGASAVTDFYVGATVRITANTGAGQARRITAYNGTTKTATVDRAWSTNPGVTSTYEVVNDAGPKTDASLRVTPDALGGGGGDVMIEEYDVAIAET